MSILIQSPQPSIFIHIPKTAGNSIISKISETYPVSTITNNRTSKNNYHSTIRDAELQIGNIVNYYKFTVVRNPWDRVTSWFLFRKQILEKALAARNRGAKFKKIAGDKNSIITELNAMNKGLETWLLSYKDQPWDFTWFAISNQQSDWISNFKFDKIVRYETLIKDLKLIPFTEFDKLPANNRSQNSKQSYREFYNDSAKKLVGSLYEKDIDTFKYLF